jgi:hypothetical protein
MLSSEHTPVSFVFRELTNFPDLKAAFQLRWSERFHANSPFLNPIDDCDLDMDCFDKQSRHFGCFEQTLLGDVLVGYFRLITTQTTAIAPIIEAIAWENSNQLPQYIRPIDNCPFHSVKIFNHHPALLNILNTWAQQQRRTCEVGRLTLNAVYRNVRLARFMIEAAIATSAYVLDFDSAFIAVDVPHQPAYRRYGFQIVPELNHYPIQQHQHSLMVNERAAIPSLIADKCQTYAHTLKTIGELVETFILERHFKVTPQY